MTPLRDDRRKLVLTGIALLVPLLVFAAPLLLHGDTLAGGDLVNHYLPFKIAVREQLAEGRFPHWNPWTFCGRPLQADLQVGLFYPPNLPFWIIPPEWAFDLTTIAHLYVGALGLALWLAARLRHAVPAVLAGGLYALGGYSTTRFVPAMVVFHYAMAWLPWMLLAWDRILDASRRNEGRAAGIWLAALVAFVALSILAGAPQIAFYSLAALGLYVLVHAWRGIAADDGQGHFDEHPHDTDYDPAPASPLERWGGAARRLIPVRPGPLVLLGAVGFIAVCLSAVQILPTRMLIGQSWDRAAGASWDYVTDGSFAPRMLLTFIAPGFFGDPNRPELYWAGRAGYHETTAYLGAAPLLLALLYFLLRPTVLRRRWTADLSATERRDAHRFEFFLLMLVAIAVLFAPGRHSIPFWLAYHLVPGFDAFRVPARFLLYVHFAVPALAAWTLDRLLVRARSASAEALDRRALRRSAVLAVVLTVLVLAALAALRVLIPTVYRALECPFLAPDYQGVLPRDEVFEILYAGAGTDLVSFAVRWLIAFAGFGGTIFWLARPHRPGRVQRTAASLLLATPVVVLLVEMLRFSAGFLVAEPRDRLRDYEYPQTERVAFLDWALRDGGRFNWFDTVLDWRYDQNQPELQGNRPLIHHLPQIRGYDPVNSRRYGEFVNAICAQPVNANPGGFMFMPDNDPNAVIHWPLLALWDCRFFLSYVLFEDPRVQAVAHWDFTSEFGPQRLYACRLTEPSGPAFLREPLIVAEGVPVGAFFNVMLSPGFDSRRHAMVTDPPYWFLEAGESDGAATRAPSDSAEEPPPGERPSDGAVRVLSQEAGFLEVDVDSPTRGILVMAQTWYPGWRAWVDGAGAPVIPANHAQCGVGVPEGRHRVVLEYRPPEFLQGLGISLVGLLLTVLVCIRFGQKVEEA